MDLGEVLRATIGPIEIGDTVVVSDCEAVCTAVYGDGTVDLLFPTGEHRHRHDPSSSSCALEGCDRPVHVDWSRSGIAHRYCGRTHARLGEGEGGLRPPHGACHECRLPGCFANVFFDRATDRVHDYCCRAHACQHLDDDDADVKVAAVAASDGKQCSLDGCPAVCFVDEGGREHDFCGRTHAKIAQQAQAQAQEEEVAGGGPSFKVGDRVERELDGTQFSAVVIEVVSYSTSGDDERTYTIRYLDDDNVETDVEEEALTGVEEGKEEEEGGWTDAGATVEFLSPSTGEWRPAKIVRNNPDGTFQLDILGEVAVEPDLIRLVAPSPRLRPLDPSDEELIPRVTLHSGDDGGDGGGGGQPQHAHLLAADDDYPQVGDTVRVNATGKTALVTGMAGGGKFMLEVDDQKLTDVDISELEVSRLGEQHAVADAAGLEQEAQDAAMSSRLARIQSIDATTDDDPEGGGGRVFVDAQTQLLATLQGVLSRMEALQEFANSVILEEQTDRVAALDGAVQELEQLRDKAQRFLHLIADQSSAEGQAAIVAAARRGEFDDTTSAAQDDGGGRVLTTPPMPGHSLTRRQYVIALKAARVLLKGKMIDDAQHKRLKRHILGDDPRLIRAIIGYKEEGGMDKMLQRLYRFARHVPSNK